MGDVHNNISAIYCKRVLNFGEGQPCSLRFANRVIRDFCLKRCTLMGVRAGVKRVTPHCLRDTFACDMLARGVDIYDVAKMLADTVDTVERHYAQFVPAARGAVQSLDTGVGIEERAKLAQTRGQKVAVFPTRRTD